VSFMSHSFIRLEKMLWTGHILDTAHLTFILQSESSFLFHPCNILLSRLLSLSLATVSEKHILLPILDHIVFEKYVFSPI
jgi:hypothetical protein